MNFFQQQQQRQQQRMEDVIGYRFQSNIYVIEALTLNVQGGNYRLAVLGDCKMDSAMIDDWYTGGALRKDWSQLRESLLSNTNLAKVAFETGLASCAIPEGYHCSDNQAATLVEAVIGAVYIDSGCDMECVKSVMNTLGIRKVVILFSLRPD
ncbi:hypothetical protein QM012_006665 [Aureobasidium pullulans]|uniref:RNase III domain-containing protein n=1 Tax=Aureobasidium pullulans TaxID=5580 RepID=A0ABR0TP95_AURPU